MPASETYSAILETARRLFIKQGYTATSMRQLAAEAGIGKATIYHHFPDKEAVAMALLESDTAGLEKTLLLLREQSDPRERIRVAASASIDYLYDSVSIIQIIRREVPRGRDQMKAGFTTFFVSFIDLLAEAIQSGVDQGFFRPVDARESARIFMTMLQGNFAMAYLGGVRPQSPQQAAESLLDIFFHGINA
jgi:AcrR family transcriptional regulator